MSWDHNEAYGAGSALPKTTEVQVDWFTLWNVWKGDDPGGFSIYTAETPEIEDESLLHIWADNEDIAHPDVEDWNYETAKKWISDWQKLIKGRSAKVILEAESLDELSRIIYTFNQ